MAAYSVTINESEVSGNTSFVTNITDSALLEKVFPAAATTAEIVFDRNINRQSENKVLVARFGDGYEQRVGDGINIKQQSFTVSFANRPLSEITVLAAFLDNKAGDSFDIVVGGETIKVATEQYNIQYVQDEIHSLSTTFRRVYEP